MADAQVVMLVPLAGGAGHPDAGLPSGGYPGHALPGGGLPNHDLPDARPPSNATLPELPPQLNPPPPEIWPGVPIRPLPPGNATLPEVPPGTVYPPLPPSVTGKALCLVWVVGVGYRWTILEAKPPEGAQPKA